jgi:hypothetical protein
MVEHGNMLQKIQMPQARLQKNPGAKKCQLAAVSRISAEGTPNPAKPEPRTRREIRNPKFEIRNIRAWLI